MQITVNGVSLWFDIDGSGLVADGPVMREKPTLILLHGGPGADHSIYKPRFAQLNDIAQILYYDHRGNGRSDDGDHCLWTLDQWADDLHALCQTLGIHKPIVLGASFGGFVAQAYVTKYPDHPSAIILSNTTACADFETIYAAFTRIGGAKAGEVARTYWQAPTPERRKRYFETCLPLYTVTPHDSDFASRIISKNPVAMHFNGPHNEMGQFDFRKDLNRVHCPTLVLSGDSDPIMPSGFSDIIVDSLTGTRPQSTKFTRCGHLPAQDQPQAYFAALRQFITEVSP